MLDEIGSLVQEAKLGNKEAFSILYEKHYQAMFHYALQLCQGNHADAQEVVQEAFLSAFEHLDQLQKPEYFPLWLKRIVHSKCIRMFYKNKEISFDPAEVKTTLAEEQRVDFIPHKNFENDTEQQILHSLVEELTEKQRQIIECFYFQQYSINEIAQILQISKGTVKSRIYEARKALKKKIDAYEAREHRKINFHFQPVLPSILTICAYHLSQCKIFQNEVLLKGSTLLATSSCAVFTISAVTSTYQSFTQEHNDPAYVSTSPVQEQVKKELESIEFPTLQYEEKEITTPRAAYYTLMKIAPDKASMDALPSEEKEALQPLLQAIQNSNTKYKEALEQNGW